MKHIDVWRSLPPEFKFDDPEELVRLWRADKVGKFSIGMSAQIVEVDPLELVGQAAEKGTPALHNLIDGHTSSSRRSPFISLTPDLRFAQLFAETPGSTLYEITLPAHRLIRDPRNTGTQGWQVDTELLTVGSIDPQEITGVKVNNEDPNASELLYEHNGAKLHATFDSDFMKVPYATHPNPDGVWKHRN